MLNLMVLLKKNICLYLKNYFLFILDKINNKILENKIILKKMMTTRKK